jgi:hypothetical protein
MGEQPVEPLQVSAVVPPVMAVHEGWETVEGVPYGENVDHLERYRVPGGWLYRTTVAGDTQFAIGLAFVPEPTPTWKLSPSLSFRQADGDSEGAA